MSDEKDREGAGGPANPAGMPEIHPLEGGSPHTDPNAPEPGNLVPGRPGMPTDVERSDADPGEE
ncbi:MAG TPA: hypothetical protein VD813_05120 [Pseudonocardia sp.]|nr:hypothetical protein [Pseudonocardia sp.]